MNKQFMLMVFGLCCTGLSAQEAEVQGNEVAVETNVETSSDVAEGKDVESTSEGAEVEASN